MPHRLISVFGALAAAVLVLPAASVAVAQTPPARTVTVVADGEARAEPDIAFLNTGVQIDGATPREALTRANERIAFVLDAIRRAGIAREDIQTSGLNVFALNEPGERGLPPGPTGYRASNSVQVTIRDLAAIPALLDSLLEAGITNLSGVRFAVQDTRALHARALAEAVAQARPLAQAAAQAVGLTVGEVIEINEVGPPGSVGPQAALAARAGGGGDFIEGGTLTYRVQVQVTFRVGQ